MTISACRTTLLVFGLGLSTVSLSNAQVTLLAVGSLTQSDAGPNADLSGLTYKLENGAPANLLGGLGSGLTYAGNNTFLALPDRGPNAVSFNSAIDDTASYINRFHTINMALSPNSNSAGLPFSLSPQLTATTLLWSATNLVYGTGNGLGVPSGVPPINSVVQHFFTGRSDNYDPTRNSGYANNARFDTESIRVSKDGYNVFISDEYGPYVYQFNRLSGARSRAFQLPAEFFVSVLSPVGATEISINTFGRTANKGMEGLAITPDGTTLVGIMQAALIQDANQGGDAANLLRIVTIDLDSGNTTHQYAYKLTTGSGVSEIVALNNHEFLVDERDGRGREGGNNLASNDARVKQMFKIDLDGAVDVSGMDGLNAVKKAVSKTLFLDMVKVLTANGLNATTDIPSKIEGLTFGPDITLKGATMHTLWIANDNDFVINTGDTPPVANPNQFFVFGFTDADLGSTKFVPQFPERQ
ncbi:MAG TPA: esterase-like activity of phytase family protein [Bryobacteraceae bacterium]|nr:esterase-like activity of phytase family protein [Bryobacteraceae bacterium]